MARIISKEVKEGFAYEAAKIAVIYGKPVEEIYEKLLDNYNKALDYAENKDKQESIAKLM